MVELTLAEAASVLDPPLTEYQLRLLVTALAITAAGKRHVNRTGRPVNTYDAATILRLHAALLPFLRVPDA